jgi:hypothetical protein
MTTERDDGGPAFPSLERVGEIVQVAHEGMSLRAYYLGKVVPELIAHLGPHRVEKDVEELPDVALKLADMMIKALRR